MCRDYTGMSLRQICERHVLPMGVEVEQLQVRAGGCSSSAFIGGEAAASSAKTVA